VENLERGGVVSMAQIGVGLGRMGGSTRGGERKKGRGKHPETGGTQRERK
jgi:hypothetical protein